MANMFNEDGTYNKTEWKSGDKITAVKLNKIELSLEVINNNDISRHVEADARLDALEAKDVAHDKELTKVKNTIADNKAAAELGDYEINSRMQFLEAMVAEVEADLDGLHAKDEELSEQLAQNTKKVIKIIGKNDINEHVEIQEVLDNNKDIDLVFEGTFNLNKPLVIDSNNVNIDASNAVFICKGSESVQNYSSNGGGIILKGENNSLNGGKFYGHKKQQLSTDNGYARSIVVCGDNTNITNVYFEDGNGGAIEIRSDYNIIQNCKFVNCNNHPVNGGDYGSINISNSSFNKIINNNIQGQYYSGISVYGCECIGNIIRDNFIKCDKGSSNTSMGIFCLMGAGCDHIIEANMIENVTAEGIMFGDTGDKAIENIKISNNIIKNCDFKCISFENTGGLGFNNIIIESNSLYVNSESYGVVLDKIFNSTIFNNIIIGSGDSYAGLLLQNTPEYNIIVGNDISKFANGIGFSGNYSKCKSNIIKQCDIGIKFSYANTSIIEDNSVYNCKEGLKTQSDWAGNYTTIKNNTLFGCNNSLVNTKQLYGNLKTAEETNLFVKGKLVNGTATITFYHVKQGNVFGVYPYSNDSSQNNGSIYIDTMDYNNSLLVIKSTNTNDTREFIVIKIMD